MQRDILMAELDQAVVVELLGPDRVGQTALAVDVVEVIDLPDATEGKPGGAKCVVPGVALISQRLVVRLAVDGRQTIARWSNLGDEFRQVVRSLAAAEGVPGRS